MDARLDRRVRKVMCGNPNCVVMIVALEPPAAGTELPSAPWKCPRCRMVSHIPPRILIEAEERRTAYRSRRPPRELDQDRPEPSGV